MSDKEHSNEQSAEAGGHAAHDHGLAHLMPLSVLFAVGGALLFLTGATVWVTYADLGRSGNLIIAMVIATIKASMVCAYFMHLKYDKPFHALVFVSSLIFVGLFISIALLDKAQYEPDIEEMNLEMDAQGG